MKVFFFNRNSLSLCLAKVSNSCFSMEPETQAQFALHFLKEHQLLQNLSLPGSEFSAVLVGITSCLSFKMQWHLKKCQVGLDTLDPIEFFS